MSTFFGIGKDPWEFSSADWHKYFYPADIIQDREKYYWSIINSKEEIN